MFGIPATITGLVGWEVYRTATKEVDELKEHCNEKYGEGNWSLESNGSSGMHQKWECTPDDR